MSGTTGFWRRAALGIAALIGLAYSGIAQPVNDNFANRIVIAGTNLVISGSNVDATSEANDPSPADEWSGCSVWWSWTAPFSGVATINTAGSDFDTLLGVYTGSALSTLSETASNDDDDSDSSVSTSKVSFMAEAGQTYQIMVAGYEWFEAETGKIVLTVKLEPLPPAPAWTLADLNGSLVNSTDYAGKVVILDFWATWCGPCRAEIPDLNALQAKYGADGLVIIGASVEGNAMAVRTFANASPMNYQLIMADVLTENAYGGIQYIPSTFIIDRQNIIHGEYVGTQTGETLEKAIIPLLYGDTRLSSSIDGNQIVLSWPINNTQNFTLESCTAPGTDAWTPWPGALSYVNGQNSVTIATDGPPRYFRLHLSY